MSKTIVYFLLLIFAGQYDRGNGNNIVDYYETLITEERKKSFAYQLPINSTSFLQNCPLENVSEFGEFDFIIIGAGSAGTVLANRLSEIAWWKILLLEAGDKESDYSDIPAMSMALQFSNMNWGYKTIPQKNCCLGMINKQCTYPRGKSLGGSSAINALMYVRGNRHDFDTWEAHGNPGWAYKQILPYFLKFENFTISGDQDYHNKGGLLTVGYAKSTSPLLDAFIQANQILGRKLVDYNGKEQIGVAKTQFNIIDGKRNSGAKAFLRSAENRKNLRVVPKALVVKILINPTTKTAYGVKFVFDCKFYVAKATKEIIISAGALNSPQLLMLSGVGPENHLKEVGLKVVHDLPGVGSNLQEHPMFTGLTFETNYTEISRPLREYIEELLGGEGPFTQSINAQGQAFIKTNHSRCKDYPDIQIVIEPPNDPNSRVAPNVENFNEESIMKYYSKINQSTAARFLLTLLHPKSRGSVRLANSSPFEFPVVDLNFFFHPQDIETMYQGVVNVLKLLETLPFKKYNARLMKYSLEACKDYEYLSKRYWICHLHSLTHHMHHPSGTCKMGPSSDDHAVVDNQLRVHGLNGLRVVDCSIMPEITSGNTNTPVYMIAEKASDMIKRKHL